MYEKTWLERLSSGLSSMGRTARAVLGFIIGTFGAGIVLAVIYNNMKTSPCSYASFLTCHDFEGKQYGTFNEFLSSQTAFTGYGVGCVFGAVGGWISG